MEGLQREVALERDARVDDGPRSAAGAQREWTRVSVVFLAPRADGDRNGLLRDFRIELATGTAERDVAAEMLWALPGSHRVTVGGDKGYDTKDFVATCKEIGATPHVAQNQHARRSSAIDERTTRHAGYPVSLRARMFIESIFGWAKAKRGLRRTVTLQPLRTGWV